MTAGPSLSEAIRAHRISRGTERDEMQAFGGLAIRDGGHGMSIRLMVQTTRRSLDMARGLIAAPRSALCREHRDAALADCRELIRAAFLQSDSIEV